MSYTCPEPGHTRYDRPDGCEHGVKWTVSCPECDLDQYIEERYGSDL